MVIPEGETCTTIMDAKQSKHDGGVSLPEDSIFEVLARLPTKSLCRFRCVCKGWRALISNPAFIAVQRSPAGPHLVGVFKETWPPEVRIMDMDGNIVRELEVTTTSTPLSTPLGQLIYVDENKLSLRGGGMVIDPAVGRAFTVFSTNLPPPPPPQNFTYSTSLGRAAPSGAFKAVRMQEPYLWNNDDNNIHKVFCEVATIMDAGIAPPIWRRRSAPPFVTCSGCDHKAVLDGVLYGMSQKLEIRGGDDIVDGDIVSGWNRIAAFDLESEEWKAKLIQGPTLRHVKANEMWRIALVEIKGSLAMVHVHVDNGQDVNVWLLVDPDKSVWVKECWIQMRKKDLWPIKLLGVLGDQRILLLVRRMEKETSENKTICIWRDALLFYNPRTKAFTDLWKWQIELHIHWCFYTGSLLS